MSAPVIRDTSHPDFPHGKALGFKRGCRQPCCRTANNLAAKRDRLRAARGYTRIAPTQMTRATLAHVDAILETVPHSTITHVARVAGVPPHTLREAAKRGTMTRTLCKAILAVKAEDVVPLVRAAPRHEAVTMIRQMQALGYPHSWQSKQCGVQVKGVLNESRGYETVRPHVHEAIRVLHERVGNTPADAERDGMTPGGITRARNEALALGFYPPACYDDAGNLDFRLIPGHPWAIADDHAYDMIDAARILTARNSDERRERLARTVGLISAADLPSWDPEAPTPDPALVTRIETVNSRMDKLKRRFGLRTTDPDRAANLARLRAMLMEWENSDEDALTFGLRTGVVKLGNLVPRTHPVVVEHLASLKAAQAGQEAA